MKKRIFKMSTPFDYAEAYRSDKHTRGQSSKWKSIAVWPKEVCLGSCSNESTDVHESEEAAQAVCELLEKHGFGGDGKIFPLSTRVEQLPPIQEESQAIPTSDTSHPQEQA